MHIPCENIEDGRDRDILIRGADTVAFCYPVYGSRVPRLMREFITANRMLFEGKDLVIFCTQMIFSGDGARCLTDLLEGIQYTVIYAEHFRMPNNINNFSLFRIAGEKRNGRIIRNALRKMDRVCRDLRDRKIVRRGFCRLSRGLGLIQGAFMPGMEERYKDRVGVSRKCTRCGVCADRCPAGNLVLLPDRAGALGHCMLCYRCTNICPEKAIRVLFRKWPVKQYFFNAPQPESRDPRRPARRESR